MFYVFLVMDTRLYTLLCWSVGRSIRNIFEFRAVFALLPWKKVCHLLLSKIFQLLKKLDNFKKKKIYHHQKIYKMSAIW